MSAKWYKIETGKYESENKRFIVTKIKQDEWLLHDTVGKGLYGLGDTTSSTLSECKLKASRVERMEQDAKEQKERYANI